MTNWFRTIALLPFLGLAACGGGGGSSPPANTEPKANFEFECSGSACNFTSTSTDQDVGDAVVIWSWAFGDGSATVATDTTASTPHTFAASGTYSVTLRVGDRFGAASTVVKPITVTLPDPTGPRASFSASCVSLDCVFTDTSAYPSSVVQTRVWDFGDNSAPATAASASVSHKYADTTREYTVRLTVTDAAGRISSASQLVTVSLPATTLLTLTQASSVTATIVSSSCSARGNQVLITKPVNETVFADGCVNAIGTAVAVNGGNRFAANTALEVTVLSGLSGTSGLVFPPTIEVTGSFANGWTLSFDDGSGGAGEPDFNDLVILIKATP